MDRCEVLGVAASTTIRYVSGFILIPTPYTLTALLSGAAEWMCGWGNSGVTQAMTGHDGCNGDLEPVVVFVVTPVDHHVPTPYTLTALWYGAAKWMRGWDISGVIQAMTGHDGCNGDLEPVIVFVLTPVDHRATMILILILSHAGPIASLKGFSSKVWIGKSIWLAAGQ